jgi:hypothetical protein
VGQALTDTGNAYKITYTATGNLQVTAIATGAVLYNANQAKANPGRAELQVCWRDQVQGVALVSSEQAAGYCSWVNPRGIPRSVTMNNIACCGLEVQTNLAWLRMLPPDWTTPSSHCR